MHEIIVSSYPQIALPSPTAADMPCRRLDQLGFRQPLGLESVPLVEKLFSDLIFTTESLKNIKVRDGDAHGSSVTAG